MPLFLAKGHSQWFFLDDWDFLAARRLSSVHDLLRPHNEHWSTLPIIVYRVLYRFVGLRSYVPYQVVLIGLQLIAALLLRRVMRRADVDPWIATAGASLFLFLGSGREDILWAFQIGFVGSLVCGFAHLIFADHDGPPDRRDAIGIGFGVIGLLCSGVAVTMTIIVGLAVLIRRGWRPAALHTIPLAAIYGVWFVGFGRSAYANETATSISQIPGFVATGMRNAFARIGQLPGVGAALAILLVVGLVLAWTRLPREQLRRRAAAPAALLFGTIVFFALSGYGRSRFGTQAAQASRYVHLAAAMTLPAVAVAADAVARRWRILLPAVIAVLVLGIPGNIDALSPKGSQLFTVGQPALMLELPRNPFARQVPRSLVPNRVGAPDVTIGWLLDGVRDGRIPKPHAPTPSDVAYTTLSLVLDQTAQPERTPHCVVVSRTLTLRLQRGDVLTMRYSLPSAHMVLANGRPSRSFSFQPLGGETIHIEAGPVTVVFARAPLAQRLTICRGR